MSEAQAAYHITSGPTIQIQAGTPEARLVEKYRQARRMWLEHKRKLVIVIDEQGNTDLFDAKPFGRIGP